MNTLKKMNEQINHELGSSYIYLSMAAYLTSKNLKGMAAWMHKQASEEREHAMKFFEYLNERGYAVELLTIEKPKNDWKTPLELFEDALKHEKKISSLINMIMETAITEKDYPSVAILQWFVTEQVEEEANASEIVEKLRMIGEHKGALLMIDKELGARQ
jgi:ferritin